MSFGHTFISLFMGCYVHVGKYQYNSGVVFKEHFLSNPCSMLQKGHTSCSEGHLSAIESLLDAVFCNKDVKTSSVIHFFKFYITINSICMKKKQKY
jgi:hypothetical protein